MTFCTYPENGYPDMFTEKSCPTCPDKWISTVLTSVNVYLTHSPTYTVLKLKLSRIKGKINEIILMLALQIEWKIWKIAISLHTK